MKLLQIKNLIVEVAGKKILNDLSLEINSGEIHALLGPNASGKSTLAKVIMGFSQYKILSGQIIFQGKDIKKKKIEERARLGISLAFQNPPALKGIILSQLLGSLKNKEIINDDILNREVNVNFSGGEKKVSELMQVFAMNPKLLILDEIDSGLDIKKRQEVFKLIEERVKKQKMAVLIITHQGEILEYLKPNEINVVIDGKIMCQGSNSKKILDTIKKYGYVKCKNCKKL